MWKPEHPLAADRHGLRYPSDLTDAEWGIVAPMIPPGRHGGRRRSVNVREVLNGIFYVLWTGRQWKRCPRPPKSTVHDYLELWNLDGTLERILHAYVARQVVQALVIPLIVALSGNSARSCPASSGGKVARGHDGCPCP
jgi:transposase